MARGIGRGAFLLLLVIGSARAGYHLVRIVILAGIGLAGMYLLHKLAQDYNKFQSNRPAATRALLRAVFKRSVDFPSSEAPSLPKEPNPVSPLEQVLLQDPLGCARKLVCQLAARSPKTLRREEQNILHYLRSISKEAGGSASTEFTRAIKRGEKAQTASVCSTEYPRCPFDASAIFRFLHFYG